MHINNGLRCALNLSFPSQVTSGEKRLYQLKNKSLESRAKGHLILTLDVEFNPIRAAVRTVNPRDPKIMYEAPKFKRAVRTAKYIYDVICRSDAIICE